MFKIEVIGNLGAAPEQRVTNGRKYITFRVADTQKWTDQATGEIHEETTWVSCIMNGGFDNLLPYLQTGAKVFVRGNGSLRVYSSQKTKQMEAGINLNVWEIELCGSRSLTKEEADLLNKAQAVERLLFERGYENWEDIPVNKKSKK